jgi:HSP20 family molecular chaperone IbpA
MADDAYLVHILVSDGKTDEVQVTPFGRSLAISRRANAEAVQEDTFDEGRGYRRSFSYSQGAVSRRIPLPPDADVTAMTREVKDGTITLRIPRSARRELGSGYGPGEGPMPMPGATPQGSGPTAGPAPAPAGQP